VLDTVDRVARQNGEPLDLRRREFDLLELLMRNRGAALYRDVIFERVWGELPDTESLRTVDTHIARLRKKLGWTDKQIETVFKIGYRLRKE
jgi:DNA-binding response OmpR family regulator